MKTLAAIALLIVPHLCRAGGEASPWPPENLAHVVAYVYDYTQDPRGSGPVFPDGSLHRGIIRSATTRLNGDQAKDLLDTLTNPVEIHESDDCYDPHHAFVFYNKEWKPVGWFAVCWRCGTYAGGSRKFPEYIELAPVRKLTKESLRVTCYEGVRIPFIMAGWMDDFIPKIGGMLVGDGNPHAVLGYLWRYLGNGGGMGMAFVCAFTLLRQAWVTPRMARYTGLCFGCLVWACLIITLKVSPHGEEVMFAITPVSLLLSWIGHVVFGYTLGWLVSCFGQDPVVFDQAKSPEWG